jgi:hypothetical protein
VEAAVVVKIASLFFFVTFVITSEILCQDTPEESLEIDMNGYFDNFGVNVVYPSINMSKNLTSTTSIHAKYLIDVVTAASMRSHFDSVKSTTSLKNNLDAYTSATPKKSGGGDNYPDEVRHEFVVGLSHFFDEISFSLSNIFSIEHDYTSETVAGNLSIPFALKNSIIQVAFVKRWDWIYPQIRSWKERKNVYEFTLGFTQVISTDLIAQAEAYYSYSNGLLIDPYQVVTIMDTAKYLFSLYEPIYPNKRNRYAGSIRANYLVGENSALKVGYRFYIDDWNIKSHTIDIGFQQMFFDEKMIVGGNLRSYFQTKAFFFKPRYYAVDEYMSVDSKLNAQRSNNFELNLDVNGSLIPLINNENITLKSTLTFYYRKTNSPDWHSRLEKLYAWIFNFGVKYNF